jgi:hypothetical protein
MIGVSEKGGEGPFHMYRGVAVQFIPLCTYEKRERHRPAPDLIPESVRSGVNTLVTLLTELANPATRLKTRRDLGR